MDKTKRHLFLECLGLLLRPLVRYCLARSIKLQDFMEVAKRMFLAVAEEELRRRGETSSTSRLSVMTGVHRKDVARLQQGSPKLEKAPTLIARVLGTWQQDKRFCTKSGNPGTLSYEGGKSQFAALVRSVSVDLNPYTVLYELERTGAVAKTRRGVKLVSRIYNPKTDLKQSYTLLAADSEDLFSAVEQNIWGDLQTPNLHIKTEYDNIVADALPDIREWFYREGSAFHQKARNFLSRFDQDLNPKLKKKQGGIRVAVGSFSVADTTTSATLEELP